MSKPDKIHGPRFFSYDPTGGSFEMHDTLEAAKAKADEAFDYCRDDAGSDGWPEEVDGICYGELRGAVVEKRRMPWAEFAETDEGSAYRATAFDEFIEYEKCLHLGCMMARGESAP